MYYIRTIAVVFPLLINSFALNLHLHERHRAAPVKYYLHEAEHYLKHLFSRHAKKPVTASTEGHPRADNSCPLFAKVRLAHISVNEFLDAKAVICLQQERPVLGTDFEEGEAQKWRTLYRGGAVRLTPATSLRTNEATG